MRSGRSMLDATPLAGFRYWRAADEAVCFAAMPRRAARFFFSHCRDILSMMMAMLRRAAGRMTPLVDADESPPRDAVLVYL